MKRQWGSKDGPGWDWDNAGWTDENHQSWEDTSTQYGWPWYDNSGWYQWRSWDWHGWNGWHEQNGGPWETEEAEVREEDVA